MKCRDCNKESVVLIGSLCEKCSFIRLWTDSYKKFKDMIKENDEKRKIKN